MHRLSQPAGTYIQSPSHFLRLDTRSCTMTAWPVRATYWTRASIVAWNSLDDWHADRENMPTKPIEPDRTESRHTTPPPFVYYKQWKLGNSSRLTVIFFLSDDNYYLKSCSWVIILFVWLLSRHIERDMGSINRTRKFRTPHTPSPDPTNKTRERKGLSTLDNKRADFA